LSRDSGTSRRRFLAVATALAATFSTAVPVEAASSANPQAGSMEAAVRTAAAQDRDLNAFYRARGHRPVWVRGGALVPEAHRLAGRIAGADFDGLDPERYRARALIAAVEETRAGNSAALARAEAALSRAYASYVHDLYRASDVGMIYVDRELTPRVPSRRAALDALGGARDLSAHLERVFAVNPVYGALRHGYAEWRGNWGNLPAMRIPAGPNLASGAAGDRVRLLRQRLGLSPGTRFDSETAQRLRAWKQAHGLGRDPVANAATIAALNRSTAHYEAMIRANLERARALPADLGRRYVLVDTASAQLRLYEDGRQVDSMKVVVGKASEQTPKMAAFIRYVTLNPYWNVPPDLVQRRIAPAVLSQGVSYLQGKNYAVFEDWDDDAARVDPAKVDWAAVAAGRRELPVRQLPGRDNAMGDMKFMLPNEHGIYLHDTPDRHLFGQANRRHSAGCVRVEDARRLARWLFGRNVRARGDAEQNVNLPEPVPVYITYFTVTPGDGGGLAFSDDPYDRDRVLMARLGTGAGAIAR
jgi:L,D-transpeptidase YcbB